jgi:hypothetical protein
MNIEEKYRIKYLISLFKQLNKFIQSKGFDPNYMEDDPAIVEWVDGMLHKTYGYKDQDERDYLFASFMKNYYATGGEFDKLGESVKPITPKLTTFKIVEDEWCDIRITNYYNVETYSKSQATSLLYNGWLDPDGSEQEVIECNDRDILFKEVTSKEETIEEDLEYWKTDSEGPEDDEYGMGPS